MATPLDDARTALLERLGLERPPRDFEEALTHSSYANEHRAQRVLDNQRLEFLGDAVLDICVSELLLEKLPDADEGVLSRAYGALVNGESLARWARDNGVGLALQVGKGAAATGISERTNVLADTVEAIVAAVYLDGGMPEARRVSALIVANALSDITGLSRRDAKTTLQEFVQARGGARTGVSAGRSRRPRPRPAILDGRRRRGQATRRRARAHQEAGRASRRQRGARAVQDGKHHGEKRRGAAMKSKVRLFLGVAVTLVLGWTSPARAGTYLDAAALLLDETRRSSSFVQSHLTDMKLIEIAHQLAEARVKCGRAVVVPKEVDRAHPHLLLALEVSERAIAAALEGEPLRFLRLAVQARDEERTFRALLGEQKFTLPELEKEKK